MGQANKRELVLRVWLPISGSGHRLSDRFGFRPSFQSKYLCQCLLIFLTLACICRYYDDDLIMNPTWLVGHGEFLDIVRRWIDDNVCMGKWDDNFVCSSLEIHISFLLFFFFFFFFCDRLRSGAEMDVVREFGDIKGDIVHRCGTFLFFVGEGKVSRCIV